MENNNKLNNKKFMSAHRRGFTMVEVIVAMGIFVIVTVGSSGVFASAFKSYRSARNINENLKNAQYAMNLMSKTFRTSTVKSSGGDVLNDNRNLIVVYDYSQSLCIRYRIFDGNLVKGTSADIETNCGDSSIFSAEDIMVYNVTGNPFYITSSKGGSDESSERVGKITVKLEITSGTGSASSKVVIQSTSSLRDYNTSNIGIDPNNDPT